MKPAPPRAPHLESHPPLDRLRERVQGAMSRLGNWGKRLLSPDQEPGTVEAVTQAPGVGDAARRQEREQTPLAGAAGPVRRVTPARISRPVQRPRSYLTEPLGNGPSARAEKGSGDMERIDAERSAALAAQEAGNASEEQVAGLAEQGGAANDPPAEPAPELTDEMRRALTRKLLKGSRNGMLLTLEPGYIWPHVLEVLAARLAEAPTFFQGSVLSVDTRRRSLKPPEVEELRALLAPYKMTFKEVGSDELNDPRVLPSGAARPLRSGDTTPTLAIRAGDVTSTLLTKRTIRSGQRLRYESSVVIMGDVNAGAEVIAGGDVVVWGALRGTVHAGYPGNEQAIVCALALAPVQLRIGSLASRPPEDGAAPPQTPEVASVKNGQIVVESWNAGRASRR